MNDGSENSSHTVVPPQLTPFKPGQSGNPKGRPKGSLSRTTLYRMWLEQRDDSGITNEAGVMQALIAKCKQGDVPAIKEIMDGSYGKVADKTELTGANGGPVAVLSESDHEILALHKQKIIDEYLKTKGK